MTVIISKPQLNVREELKNPVQFAEKAGDDSHTHSNYLLNTTDTLTGNLTVSADLDVGAALTAVTKSFLITHPLDTTRKLRYGSLEGPENGVYIRGRITGTNKIELPDYWTKLVDDTTITVALTAIDNQTVFVKDVNIHEVIVGQSWLSKLFGKKIDCYYTIYAERNDVDKLVVEE